MPVCTKLQFDIWNEDEVKFTGAFECADSWHETEFGTRRDVDIQTSAAASTPARRTSSSRTLGTFAARYRVQGVKSAQCEDAGRAGRRRITQAVGVIAVQSSLSHVPLDLVGTTLAAAGKFNGKIVWDPEGAVPEGGIR